jgi:serine/threonine-protein kinase
LGHDRAGLRGDRSGYARRAEQPAKASVCGFADVCSADAALLDEVSLLLAANERAGDFIAAPVSAAAWLTQDDDDAALTGTVGAYVIERRVGRGGMGEVYLAHDSRLGRKVALKLLRPDLTGHPDVTRRFEQEARAASSLNHPNIVTIYEIGEVGDRRFLAMEFVDGQPPGLSARCGG